MLKNDHLVNNENKLLHFKINKEEKQESKEKEIDNLIKLI